MSTKRCKVRARSFWTHAILSEVDNNWVREDGPDLDTQVNEWLKELDVQAYFVSAPAINFAGRDAKGRLFLTISISLLYLAEDEVDESETREASDAAPGSLGALLSEFQRQLPPGLNVRDIIKVVNTPDTGESGDK